MPESATSDTLQPLKHWSHPFKDKSNPLLQLTQLAKATAGYYPLGRNGIWHGGVHFDSGTGNTLDQSSVHCLADGEVVAYRIDHHSPTTTCSAHLPAVEKPFSRNFVLVRHRLQLPRIEGSPDTPPGLTFFSLYMHLQDWADYQSDLPLTRPAFWPESETRRVKESVIDVLPGTPGQQGLNVRNQLLRGKVLALLPRGAQVVVSGEGHYRKLENTTGPDSLKSPDGSLRGYLSIHFLEPLVGGQHQITANPSLNVRAEANATSAILAQLPSGTEVTVSGEGAFRKLEHVNQYVHFNSLEGAREPTTDHTVVLDSAIKIKAGDLIGHIGLYQDSDCAHPKKKLHLEVFSGDDVEIFIQNSRDWAQRLPASGKTWLKLAKGTAVVAHQDHFNASSPPTPGPADPLSDADLLLPKGLLDSLPAERKMAVPATADHPARIWYRLDGLLHDASNTLLDGWVCEEVDVTPRINPWSWEGYETIFNHDTPQQSLASFFRAIDHFSENERQHYEVMANLSDKGPMKRRLYDIIDRNHDGKMTAQELQTAIALPAHAQSLSQLIIHCESEWHYTPQKWDALDKILGHYSSSPNLNWSTEKERIKQISWWHEVAAQVGLPLQGRVFHFHPVGLMGFFGCRDGVKILAGEITFNAEGNNIPSSMHYSKVIHWPGNSLSGVTLGRGYDMGSRTQLEIYAHMTQAGIDDSKSRKISLAHGLKGLEARNFITINKAEIGEITDEQQISLFNVIYPDYINRAIFIYNKWTTYEPGRMEWASLDPVIRDVLVDFVYQGFTAGPNPMKSGMYNSRQQMITYIENTPAISQYEAGRLRANYLKSH